MPEWSTAYLSPPSQLIDQVIGQEKAVQVIRLAARQRRFVLLVGEPGTGKSMLGRSMADLLPLQKEDPIVILPNQENPIFPIVKRMSKQEYEELQKQQKYFQQRENFANRYFIYFTLSCLAVAAIWVGVRDQSLATFIVLGLVVYLLWQKKEFKTLLSGKSAQELYHSAPKILYSPENKTPFIDATGFSEGALFGDVRHDPYQSGGVETPPHLLVEAGAVHKAHGGVLYIDEISTLSLESQRLLLTAIQEKALPITGRHQGSSGTLIATAPVPCDFVLIAAGHQEDIDQLLPAFRSRILGFGYEVMTQSSLADNPLSSDHFDMFARFISQEVAKDGKIPHFNREAVLEVYHAARERSPHPGYISARWRELGGLIRVAGDLATVEGSSIVCSRHVIEAKIFTASLDSVQCPPQRGHVHGP